MGLRCRSGGRVAAVIGKQELMQIGCQYAGEVELEIHDCWGPMLDEQVTVALGEPSQLRGTGQEAAATDRPPTWSG